MEVLVLDGRNYVKASKAARDLGYATDYVGQLCRSGKVDAHLIGRTWYVNQEQLGTHRVEKKRMSRVKAREQAKRSIEEHRQKKQEPQNNYRNIVIQYEEDGKELIPETRKLAIESLRYRTEIEEESDDTQIENEGEKVMMSGDLNVVDVNEGYIDTDTIVLSPSKIKKGPKEEKNTPPDEEDQTISETDDASIEQEVVSDEPLSFAEKLEVLNTEEPSMQDPTVVNEVGPVSVPITVKTTPSYALLSIVLLILTALVLSTLPVTAVMEYSADNSNQIVNSYPFSIVDLMSLLSIKI